MNAEEIRKKAIECADEFIMKCEEHSCRFCSLGLEDVKARMECKTIYGYEHGFSDGVEEGKRLAIKHAHWTPTEYDGYADGNPVWDVYTCSACGDEHYGDSDTLTDFCPCCGARMDEEGEQNDERKSK